MTQAEIKDKYWHEYLVWCAEPPRGDGSEMVLWLDLRKPAEDYFWEWLIYKKKVPKL